MGTYYITDTAQGPAKAMISGRCSAYYNNRTYIVYQGPKTTGDGDPWIVQYDRRTGLGTGPTKVATNLLAANDYHGMPIMLVRTDTDHVGKILVIHSIHSSPTQIQWTESTSAEDISAWGASAGIGSVGTYAHLVQVANGDIYLFYRSNTYSDARAQAYRKMAAGASTWGAEVVILDWRVSDLPNTTDEIQGSVIAYDSVNNRLWMTFTVHADESTTYKQDYVCYFNPTDGKIYDAEDTGFAVPVTKANFDSASYKFRIANATLPDQEYQPSVVLDENNRPHTLRLYYDDSDVKVGARHTYWTGTAWTTKSVATENMWGGGVLDYQSSSSIDAYIATTNGLDRYHYDGASWAFAETLLGYANEPADFFIAQPELPTNWDPSLKVVFSGYDTVLYASSRIYATGSLGLISWPPYRFNIPTSGRFGL